MSAHVNATQIGGSHYKDLAIEPWDFHFANRLLWAEGEIIKYVTRWKSKGGVNDLRKAEHIIQKMIYAAVNFDWPNRPLTDLELAQLMNLDVTPRDEPAGAYTVDTTDTEVQVSPETDESAINLVHKAVAGCTAERERVHALCRSIASAGRTSEHADILWNRANLAFKSLADASAELACVKALILEARPHE